MKTGMDYSQFGFSKCELLGCMLLCTASLPGDCARRLGRLLFPMNATEAQVRGLTLTKVQGAKSAAAMLWPNEDVTIAP